MVTCTYTVGVIAHGYGKAAVCSVIAWDTEVKPQMCLPNSTNIIISPLLYAIFEQKDEKFCNLEALKLHNNYDVNIALYYRLPICLHQLIVN